MSKNNNIEIYKIYLRIVKTKDSAKKSGNRCIIKLDYKTNEIKVLLVYHKNDINTKNETSTIKKILKDNYKDLSFFKMI